MNDLEMVTSKIVSAREIIDTAADAIQKNDYDRAETLAMAAYEFLGYYLEEFDEKFKLAWDETVKKQPQYQYTATGEAFEIDTTLDDVLKEREYYEPTQAPLSCDKEDSSPECKGAWNDFWESYYPEESQQYTEEELNAMCDKAELDNQLEEIRKAGGYEWTPVLTKVDGYSVDGKSHSEYYYDYTRNDPNRLNPFSGKVYESPDGGKTVYARNPGETERQLVKQETPKKKWVLPVEQVHDDYYVSFPDDLLKVAKLKEGDEVNWIDNGDGSFSIRKVHKV